MLASTTGALSGADRTLATLAAHTQPVQTGSLRDVARNTLDVFGLRRCLDLDASADGDTRRSNLVVVALRRAADTYGMDFDLDNTYVIGDTGHDIDTGIRGGSRTVGVASRTDSVDQLRHAGADAAWPDLTNTDATRTYRTG